MTIKVFVEGYPIQSSRSWGGKNRVKEWGWRIALAATGDVIAFDGGHQTKKAAVAAGRNVAVGFYHYDEGEVIELTRRHNEGEADRG